MMKFFTIILNLYSTTALSQNHELSSESRYGISTKNMTMLIPNKQARRDYLHMKSLRDIGIGCNYSVELWDKGNIHLTSTLLISQSTHYQPITESLKRVHLDNIVVQKPRIDIQLGLMKRLSFHNGSLLLDLSSSIVYRQFFQEKHTYQSDFQFNYDNRMEYSYTLNTYHGVWHKNNLEKSYRGLFGGNIAASLKVKLTDHSFFDLTFSCTTRNTFFYDYIHTIRYYNQGSSSPTSTITHYGYIDSKYGSLDTFLYLNIGYTYQLKKKEKD